MLPTLANFGIILPVYLRKIDKKSHWHPENANSDERVNKVAEKVFKEDICSIWKINSDEEFYGVIAALSSTRNPRQQDLDFIYLTEQDLEEFNISKEQTQEGYCLFVKHLHYNIELDRQTTRKLCGKLIAENREPQRCKKKSTQAILEHQGQKNCKAIANYSQQCSCEM